jgi:protein phosphatase/serine/threonine-protein phosphatase BSU1
VVRNPLREDKSVLDCIEIADLYESVERIFSSESSSIKFKAVIEMFGHLQFQFCDVMSLFHQYGSPSTAGDIA